MPDNTEIETIAHQLAALAVKLARGDATLAKAALGDAFANYKPQQKRIAA